VNIDFQVTEPQLTFFLRLVRLDGRVVDVPTPEHLRVVQSEPLDQPPRSPTESKAEGQTQFFIKLLEFQQVMVDSIYVVGHSAYAPNTGFQIQLGGGEKEADFRIQNYPSRENRPIWSGNGFSRKS
jgi:hypothetical protein